MHLRRLDGVVCVVTGAARGIGLAIAERLAAEGGRVAAWDVSERRLEPAVDGLRRQGLDVQGFTCDVGERTAVAQATSEILKTSPLRSRSSRATTAAMCRARS